MSLYLDTQIFNYRYIDIKRLVIQITFFLYDFLRYKVVMLLFHKRMQEESTSPVCLYVFSPFFPFYCRPALSFKTFPSDVDVRKSMLIDARHCFTLLCA